MSDALVLRVSRRLESPNRTRGYHWRRRHRERQQWEYLIARALVECGGGTWQLEPTGVRLRKDGSIAPRYTPEVRKVTIVREVPSARNFIRDDDNLVFAAKPINDALKRLALIYDDRRGWLEQPMPAQRISKDGQDWTQVTIERVG